MSDKDIDSDDWREDPFRAAREFRHLKDAGSFEPGFLERLKQRFGSGESMSEEERDALKPFLEFIEDGDYYSASVISDAVLDDSPARVDAAIETVLNNLLEREREEIGGKEINEAFALLDSFEQGTEITEEDRDFAYEYTGSERVIDNLAISIWRDLDGSAKAFFEKYVEDESDAFIFTEDGEKRLEGSYIETAVDVYEQVLEEDPYSAQDIAERFDLSEDRITRAEELQKVEEAVDKLEEGNASELTEEELDLLEQENIDLIQFNEGNRFNTEIGNFLTDRYLWRTNPDDAQYAGNEDIVERIRLSRKGRRNGEPDEEGKHVVFDDLIRSNDFYAASKYAETAGIDAEEKIEEAALSLIEVGEEKKAFAALDAFDYEKTTEDLLEEGYSDFYLVAPGPKKLIDKLATDIWKDLEGASRAFFQMYVNSQEEDRYFQKDTVATVYHPFSQKPRGEDSYLEDFFTAYESILEEDEEQAEEILDRFDIDMHSY